MHSVHADTDAVPYDRQSRAASLLRLGATEELLPALLDYTENPYRLARERIQSRGLPLPDEPHLTVWREYASEAESGGATGTWQALRSRLVQLRFPIRAGASQESAYLAATRRGVMPAPSEPGLELLAGDGLRLEIHPTPAGAVPVVVVTERADFVALVQALVGRNEPIAVADSMGACLVKGLVNWDRVARYRRAWQAENPDTKSAEAAWKAEFSRLSQRKELYQDRVLLLSSGPYSAASAAEAGTSPARWLEESLIVRREHECFHYLTLRLFGLIRSNLLDELLADAAGLLALDAGYRPGPALRFLGIDPNLEGAENDPPRLYPGARLELHRGEPPLPEEATPVLVRLAQEVVANLGSLCARLDREIRRDSARRSVVLLALAAMGLEQLASLVSAESQERFAAELEGWLACLAAPAAWSFELAGDESGVAACLDAFHRHARAQGLREETRGKLGVVLDEILTNVAKHALAGADASSIRIELRPRPRERVELLVEDSGKPFNPLFQPAPELLAPLAERRVGGLGIYLVRHLSSRLHYERRDGKNRLTVELS